MASLALKRAGRDLGALTAACTGSGGLLREAKYADGGNNIFEWEIVVEPPNFSIYAGKPYRLRFSLSPESYPIAPPNVRVLTPIFNPIVAADGKICEGVLKNDDWKPTTSIVTVVERIVHSVFVDYMKLDALNEEAARLLHQDEVAFVRRVKETE